MCEFEKHLVAWLDRELPDDEDAELELHIRACAQCRSRAEAYERSSLAFSAYCDAAMAVNDKRKTSRRKIVAMGAGAVAAAAALAFLTLHPHQQVARPQPRVTAPAAKSPRTVFAEAAGTVAPREPTARVSTPAKNSVRIVQPKRTAAEERRQQTRFVVAEPAMQVDIPADALLPPGAVPAGTNFVVDFSLAPDGSAQEIRVTPQLAGFERRVAQP